MPDDDSKIRISRRKALGALGTIGVASAGAGLGTSAYLNDTESIENTITAGTLDMEVTAELAAVNQPYKEEVGIDDVLGGSDHMVTADQKGAVMGYELDDVKPGDWFIIKYCVSIGDNPGYLVIHSSMIDETAGDIEGNEYANGNNPALGDELLLTHWNDTDGSVSGPGDLKDLSQTTNKKSAHHVDETYSTPDEDGNATLGGGTDVGYTDVLEFAYGVDQDPRPNHRDPDTGTAGGTELGNGYASANPVGGAGSGGIAIREGGGLGYAGDGEELNPYRKVGNGSNGHDELCFYQLIQLPKKVGNEVQGDSLSFDLAFVTTQTRHQSGPGAARQWPFDN